MRAVLALLWLAHLLPLPVLGRIGKLLGSVLFLFLKSRRRIALINLGLCFPELSQPQRKTLARQHFQAYARSVLERSILWWASEKRLRRLIAIEPGMPDDSVRGGPTILLCPHFVSLDVAATALALHYSGCSIYSRQANPVMDRALLRGRSRFCPQKLFPRNTGVKPILRAMREGLPFFMLPDMDFGARDAQFVPFFGVPAATLTAVARIAALTQARVVPVIATMLPGYRGWRVKFHPPWTDFPGPDVAAATLRVNQFIESQVLLAPAEYFWVHRRFKTRPPGEPGFYGAAKAAGLKFADHDSRPSTDD